MVGLSAGKGKSVWGGYDENNRREDAKLGIELKHGPG
jgi:hypothetical protein